MAADYFVLVFFAGIGVLQIASIPAGMSGLWLFNHRKVQYVFGAATVAGAFAWFYAVEERNVQHTVEGAQQLTLFLLAVIAAFFCTGIIASLIRARQSPISAQVPDGKPSDIGMLVLRSTTLLRAIRSRVRNSRTRDR